MKATMAGDVGGDVEVFAAKHDQSTLTKASSAAHNAITSLSEKSGPAISRVAKLAHDLTDKASGAGTRSAEWMHEKNAHLAGKKDQLMESTKTYVSTNPLKALGMGLLAGIILSRIL